MLKSAPVRSGKISSWLGHVVAAAAWALALALLSPMARAQDLKLEAIDVQPLPGQQLQLRLRTNGTAPEPMAFTIENPARISIDLPNTALGSSQSPPRRERRATHLDSCGRGQRPYAHRLQPEQHGAVSDAGRGRQRLRDARPSPGRRAAAVVRGPAGAERSARRRRRRRARGPALDSQHRLPPRNRRRRSSRRRAERPAHDR